MKKNNKKVIFLLSMVLTACTMSDNIMKTKDISSSESLFLSNSKQLNTQTSSLYEITPKPLNFEECIRCHYPHFTMLKEKGGKHQRECTFCHTTFHAYNPKKQNWDEIMPKCQNCHGLKHGEKFPICLTCHKNPHMIKEKIKVTEEFSPLCGQCHSRINDEINQNQSKHTSLGCAFCHSNEHGYKPQCFDCHKGHIEGQTYKDCLSCHKPHSPLKIPAFAANTPQEICASCHAKPYEKLNIAGGKHKSVGCVKCHTAHKFIPDCRTCHGQPHNEALHKKYPKCTECHVDVHAIKS
jgi:predicted CXXCH cytochrome family protein